MLKTKKVSEYQLPIKINPQKDGGFVATCPVWTDCFAEGDSIDEVVLEITAVAQSLIELYKEEELRIPLKIHEEKGFFAPINIPVFVSA